MAFNKDNFAFKGDLGNANTPNIATYKITSDDDISVVGYFNDVADSLKAGDIIHTVNLAAPESYKFITILVSSVVSGVVTIESAVIY